MTRRWSAEMRNDIAWAAYEEGQRGRPKLTPFVLERIGAPAIIGKHRKDTMK